MNREGAFYVQGLFVMGTATNAVDYRDSDRVLFILDTPKVHSEFNGFEIRHASSRVDWTRYTVKALGTTSRGRFIVTNDADVNLASCSFIDMDSFSFLAATAALDCVFLRCNAITAPGSNLSGSQVTSPTVAADTSAVIWNVATDPDGLLDDMVFTKGTNAHHAIELGTSSPTTINLRGLTFSGFNASNAATDSVIHVKRTTGSVTINAIGCTGVVSYKTDGATVTVVVDPVTLGINVTDLATGDPIQSARVYVTAAAGGDLGVGTVLISGTTDVNGRITDSRSYTADQPVTGWVRRAPTAGPHYKEGPVAGVVDSTTGLEVTVQMVGDG
jgi:hypothetical protein